MKTFKCLLILMIWIGLQSTSVAQPPVCSSAHGTAGAPETLTQFIPKKIQMSHSFFRSTYDYQTVGVKRPDGILMVLAKRVSIREMVQSQHDYEDCVVQIRTPKNSTVTKPFAANKVQSLDDAKALLDQVPISGGVSNHIELEHRFDELFEILNFVLSRYKEDKQWPDEFYRDLARWSFRYFFQSSYIVVRKKMPDGQIGPIIGTVRLIVAPYQKTSDRIQEAGGVILTESSNWNSVELRNGTELLATEVQIPKSLMNTFWKDLFPNGKIDFKDGGFSLFGPETRTENGTTYVLTPMESVLRQAIPELRGDADQSLRNLIEPGNFSIDRKYARLAAPLLYLHMARLAQAPQSTQSMGQNSKSITYAEKGSDTHRYYHSLGLRELPEKLKKSPTDKPWDILGGDESALLRAFKTRFAKDDHLSANVDSLIQKFNQVEQNFWAQADRSGNSPGHRSLGFSHQTQIVQPVETLFQDSKGAPPK